MSAAPSNSIRHTLCRCLLAVLIAPLELHADTGSDLSTHFLDGWNAYEAGDYRRAVTVWTTLAEQDHVDAQINLGFMYDYGNGVERDHQTAAHWYRAAASRGSGPGHT